MIVIPNRTIVVWFSCGAASAVAAKRTIQHYGNTCNIKIVNNPVLEEHQDNQRFLQDVEQWLGYKIEFAINSLYPNCSAVEVWDNKKAMSFVNGAPCTQLLKKHARFEWEKQNHFDYSVFGFTVDEIDRHNNLSQSEIMPIIPVLINEKLTKQDCFNFLEESGVRLPEMYYLGYPNANCIGCVKATSPTYWNHVRIVHPDIFDQRAEQSRRLNVRLVRVKNKRIFLDELDPSVKGNAMKDLKSIDCGVTCNTAI